MRWIIDGHEDLAWNAVMLGRDLAAPVATIRQAEGPVPAHGDGTATVSLPALRAADVRVVLATLFVLPQRPGRDPVRCYHSPEEAHCQAIAQLEYYEHSAAVGEVTLLHTADDLAAAVAQRVPTPGLVLLMEGADPLRTPDDLSLFVERGVRSIGLSWKGTRYAGGTDEPGPLTLLGETLLREMERLGVALDLSHLADVACWQALRRFRGRVIASHANCRALSPGDRQLSDDLIRAIADRDGAVGLVMYNRFIRPDWDSSAGKDAVRLADLAAHARYIADLVGPRYVALGTDLDGGLGREDVPREIDTVLDLPRFADALANAGFTRLEIDGVLGENWRRVLSGILPSA